jgi:hypothetical protein
VSRTVFFQKLKHGSDEVVNRIQDNIARAFDSVQVLLDADATYLDVQTFIESGAWVAPEGAIASQIFGIGSGSGGASGRRGAVAGGGAGGLHAGFNFSPWIPASVMGERQIVTIGAAGPGGAAVTVDNTDGNVGGAGGAVTVGGLFTAFGGGNPNPGTAAGGGAAGTGTLGNFATSVANGAGGADGVSGSPGAQSRWGPAGGGGGAGRAGALGGAGGNASADFGARAPGGASNLPGTSIPAGEVMGGGGGGGGATGGATGAPGQAGGRYGAGGGGGSGSANGNNSGAGGAGGRGIVQIITLLRGVP